MQNTDTTVGKTARTMVIFRDCHAKNNIIVPLVDNHVERFYTNFARRMGWHFTIRTNRPVRKAAGRKECAA